MKCSWALSPGHRQKQLQRGLIQSMLPGLENVARRWDFNHFLNINMIQLCSEPMMEMAILMKLKFQGSLFRISINKYKYNNNKFLEFMLFFLSKKPCFIQRHNLDCYFLLYGTIRRVKSQIQCFDFLKIVLQWS